MSKFTRLAKPYYKTATMALQKLVSIDSHYDESSISKERPYGAGVDRAFDYLLKLAKEYGFEGKKVLGRAVEISYGHSGPLVGIYAHADVVPASGKWTIPPFKPAIDAEGKMIGRGTSDDKGPLMAALFGLKLLKDHGMVSGYRVKLVVGGDEERGSSCLEHYFHEAHGEEPALAFTPDADYPLIYAEKGIDQLSLSREIDLSPVIALSGGTAVNAVCDCCLVTLTPDEKFVSYLQEKKVDCDIAKSDVLLMVTFKGRAAHGAEPEKGSNAALAALKALSEFYHNEELGKIYEALRHPLGSSFGGGHVARELGPSTFNYGLFSYDGKTLKFTVDFRYGEDCDYEKTEEKLKAATGAEITLLSRSPVLLSPKDGLLVKTLMKVYRAETWKLFDKPLAIGGNTYAKHVKNCVAFGAAFPGHDGRMHAPDEYIYMDDFHKDIAIYAHAIDALGKAARSK